MKKVFALAVLTIASAFAQQTTFQGQDGIISHVVDGDGWQTIVSLNNIDPSPSQYKLSFFTESGAPLTLQTNLGTGTYFYGTIPARGTVTIQTAGANLALTQGWAKMETIFVLPTGSFTITPGARVAGTALFYRPPYVSRPAEASEPLDFSVGSKWVLPFDHTNGYATGVALVNPSAYSDISVFLTFYDELGNQIANDALTLAKGQHIAFTLTQKYSTTVGKRGTFRVELQASP